ncbi:MAG: flagellar hook capping FlgD N-terminal domain-containing protein [Tepidisphaeraceae bacterium]|jgi:flagellar basal-body rod modification protein FlgD
MSAIGSQISSLGGGNQLPASTSTSNSTSSSTDGGLSSLTATNFVQFLITELQNQDPMDPTDTSQMLGELSEIGQMQSSSDLQTSLTSMVQQNQVASAANMIGKYVQGTDSNGNSISGNVTSVQVTSNAVNLGLDNGLTMGLSAVSSIGNATTSSSSSTSSTTPGS